MQKMDRKKVLANVVNRMDDWFASLEHISETENGIKIVVSSFIIPKNWLDALIYKMDLLSPDKRRVYEVSIAFKGITDKSGTAFVDGKLLTEFTNTTETGRSIQQFYISEKEGRYRLHYWDEGGLSVAQVEDLTMEFNFEDCEFRVELIRDEGLELREV